MIVALCQMDIKLAYASSLKEKRQIVKSIIQRVKNKFNVSIAEIGYLDKWQMAKIGIAYVSNSLNRSTQEIDFIISFLDQDERIEICQIEREMV